MSEYEPHPLAQAFPLMTGREYEDLCASIATNGLQVPVVIYEGRILDGRNRARACEATGVELLTDEYEGDEPATYVVDTNVHRRHLTVAQRAVAALQLHEEIAAECHRRKREGGRNAGKGRPNRLSSRDDNLTNDRSGKADDIVGARLGIGSATVGRAKRVKHDAPDLWQKVVSGETTVNAAYNVLRQQEQTPADRREPAVPARIEEQRAKVAARDRKTLKLTAAIVNAAIDAYKQRDQIAVAFDHELGRDGPGFVALIARLRDAARRIDAIADSGEEMMCDEDRANVERQVSASVLSREVRAR